MVNHWLNWNDNNNNVVVSNHVSLCVGSCGKEQLFSVDQKLGSGVPIATALDNANLKLITFKSLIDVRFEKHSSAVLIKYRKKETVQSIEIELGSQEKAEEFFDHISQYVCTSMVKRLRDSSPYYSLVLIVCSFLFAGVFLYSYFNKFRLLAYLLPVLCLIGTFAYVSRMEKVQRRIIRWSRESERLRLDKPALVAIGGCLIFSALSLSTAPYFDDRYGQSALYSAAKSGVLEADDIAGYINRGAYVNYAPDETDSVLRWALERQAHDVTLELIKQGADVRANQGRLLEYAIQHRADETVLFAMMERGALETAEVLGGFDTKHYLQTNTGNFAKVYRRYRDSQ